jgi:hypothetical protein
VIDILINRSLIMTDTNQQELTESAKIWNEIKDRSISMFALPAQKVSDYCQPVEIDKTRCFLLHKAAAVIPSLEAALGKDFTLEAVDKYLVITRAKNAF